MMITHREITLNVSVKYSVARISPTAILMSKFVTPYHGRILFSGLGTNCCVYIMYCRLEYASADQN